MICYHGTVIPGLKELRPFSSEFTSLPDPVVYLTTSKQLALHYIWDMKRIGVKMPMLKIQPDGVLIFQEMFSGALEYFYKGVSGYIYTCQGDFPMDSRVQIPFCTASDTTVPVTEYEYIEDVYAQIMRYQERGTFVYEKYESLPQWRIDIIRGTILRFIHRNQLLIKREHAASRFVMEKFPQYWKEAEILAAHGFL